MKLPKPFSRTQKQVILSTIPACIIGFYIYAMWGYWRASASTCKPPTISDELSQKLAQQLDRLADRDWRAITAAGDDRLKAELFAELKRLEALSNKEDERIYSFHNAILTLGGYLVYSMYSPSVYERTGSAPEKIRYHYIVDSNKIGLSRYVFRWVFVNVVIANDGSGRFTQLHDVVTYLPEVLEAYPGWKAPRQVTPCPTLPEELREAYRAQYPESWRAHNPS